jgi:hypothetical protein
MTESAAEGGYNRLYRIQDLKAAVLAFLLFR